MKLGNITYQKVAPARSADPSGVVREYRQKQNLLNQSIKIGNQIAGEQRDYIMNKANAGYADEMSAFRSEAAKVSVADRAAIKAMGLDDEVDMEGREYVPKIEWYPKALQKQMDLAREKYGTQIRFKGDRDSWVQETATTEAKQMEQEIVNAANESREFYKQEKQASADAAYRSGNWQTARDIYSDPFFTGTPELRAFRETQLVNIDKGEEKEIIRNEVEAMTPNAKIEYASELRGQDYNEKSVLDADELEAIANGIERAANTEITQAETAAKDLHEARVNDHITRYASDPRAMIERMPEDLDLKEKKAIYAYANTVAKGLTTDTNEFTWQMLETMSPGELRNANLPEYRDKLSSEHYQYFVKKKNELIAAANGTADISAIATNDQLLAESMSVLGFDTKTKNKGEIQNQIAVKSLIRNEWNKFQQENQREPTYAEKQAIVNEINTSFTMSQIKYGFQTGPEPRQLKDVENIPEVMYGLKQAGNANPTPEEIVYGEELMDKGLELTRLNLEAAARLSADGIGISERNIKQYIQRNYGG